MFKLLCVTNRKLCRGDFLARIERIAACGVAGIVLREKDLPPDEYRVLAEKVLAICRAQSMPCILHNFIEEAAELKASAVHLPLPVLRQMKKEQKASFRSIGASCHSMEDVQEAQELGCTYITAGHIFATDCKKGVPGRGIAFLQSVVAAVDLPVFAIGGINRETLPLVYAAGASGACVMSGFMRCGDVHKYLREMGN